MRGSLRVIVPAMAAATICAEAARAQGSPPPSRTFGPDTTATGGPYTGGEPTGLICTPSTAPMKCSGYLASDDGTKLDCTGPTPAGSGPHPLVVYLHGYGGSKKSDSSYDDRLAARGYLVLRYSPRGFGHFWGHGHLSERGR